MNRGPRRRVHRRHRAIHARAVRHGRSRRSHRTSGCRPRIVRFSLVFHGGVFFSLSRRQFLYFSFLLKYVYFFTVLRAMFPECVNGRNPLNRGHVRRTSRTCEFSRVVTNKNFRVSGREEKRREFLRSKTDAAAHAKLP